jgi:5'(3')-deoxyribonucleotidase
MKNSFIKEFGLGFILGIDESFLKKVYNEKIPNNKFANILTKLPKEKIHVTLVGLNKMKEISNLELDLSKLEKIDTPEIKLGKGFFVFRKEYGKISYVLLIKNQEDVRKFVNKCFDVLGLENPEPNKLYHITLANNKDGNSLESIGDVNQDDLVNSENERLKELIGIKDKFQIWFDLDGVLADMDRGVRENEYINSLRGQMYKIINSKLPEYKKLSRDEIKSKIKSDLETNPNDETVKEFKKIFKKWDGSVFKAASQKGFYKNLKVIKGSKELVDKVTLITRNIPNVVSSPVGNENNPQNPSVIEKKEWVKEHFRNKINHIEITSDKGRVVRSEFDILIDDRQKYIDKFVNAGGSGILFKNKEQVIEDLKKIIQKLSLID